MASKWPKPQEGAALGHAAILVPKRLIPKRLKESFGREPAPSPQPPSPPAPSPHSSRGALLTSGKLELAPGTAQKCAKNTENRPFPHRRAGMESSIRTSPTVAKSASRAYTVRLRFCPNPIHTGQRGSLGPFPVQE